MLCCSRREEFKRSAQRDTILSAESNKGWEISSKEKQLTQTNTTLYRLIVQSAAYVFNCKSQNTMHPRWPTSSPFLRQSTVCLHSWLKFIIYTKARRWIEYLIMPRAAPRRRDSSSTLRLIPLLLPVYIYELMSRFAIRCCISLYIYLSRCVVKSSVESTPSGITIIARRLHCAFDA